MGLGAFALPAGTVLRSAGYRRGFAIHLWGRNHSLRRGPAPEGRRRRFGPG